MAGPAASPADAAKQLVSAKKISKKINHSVFNELFETEDSLTALKSRNNTPEPALFLTQKDSAYGGSQLPGATTSAAAAAKGGVDYSQFEFVEETDDAIPSTAASAKAPAQKVKMDAINAGEEEEEDDEEDEDHMAEDELVLRNARKIYGDEPTEEDYYDYDDE
jgi:transcription factor IIIB subunit 2